MWFGQYLYVLIRFSNTTFFILDTKHFIGQTNDLRDAYYYTARTYI